jgi:alkylhydroperoxidase/carboxymuconolactone decarboxylase family protein YurZ
MDSRNAADWTRSLELLRDLDPEWSEAYSSMVIDPFLTGTFPAKEYHLIAVGLSASATNSNETALRRHVASALRAGASKAEILEVLKMAALVALHSMSMGAPMLLEAAEDAGETFEHELDGATPACDAMKSIGRWNTAWDPFFELDPIWTEAFVAAVAGLYTNGVLTPKFIELASIAIDASVTHMYAPGTQHHIKAALALGATPEEIMTVLKLCVSQGADALHRGVPILAEEAERFAAGATPETQTS